MGNITAAEDRLAGGPLQPPGTALNCAARRPPWWSSA